MNLRVLALSTLLAAGAVWSVPARTQEPGQRVDPFVVREEMIPMRDGVRLHTKIFVPREPREPLPFIMLRTPYGIERPEGQFVTYLKALADEGYIFVFQDIRGKFGSDGAFVMQRPARTPGDTSALDEGTDTYDTIEWLLQNVRPNNGRAGMLGVSYVSVPSSSADVSPGVRAGRCMTNAPSEPNFPRMS